MEKTLEGGYYWIRLPGDDWEIGQYMNGHFWLCGNACGVRPSALEVGELAAESRGKVITYALDGK